MTITIHKTKNCMRVIENVVDIRQQENGLLLLTCRDGEKYRVTMQDMVLMEITPDEEET